MPIDYKNYPPNWRKEIRPRILARDGHKCKFCQVPDGSVVERSSEGHYRFIDGAAFHGSTGEPLAPDAKATWSENRVITIVLTTAHLDHALVDHADDNLVALCQQCHTRYDKPIVAKKAGYTRKYGRATLPIVFLP